MVVTPSNACNRWPAMEWTWLCRSTKPGPDDQPGPRRNCCFGRRDEAWLNLRNGPPVDEDVRRPNQCATGSIDPTAVDQQHPVSQTRRGHGQLCPRTNGSGEPVDRHTEQAATRQRATFWDRTERSGGPMTGSGSPPLRGVRRRRHMGACSREDGSSGRVQVDRPAPVARRAAGERRGRQHHVQVRQRRDVHLAMAADPGNLDPQASAASNLYQFSYFAYDGACSTRRPTARSSRVWRASWQVKGTKTVLDDAQVGHLADGCRSPRQTPPRTSTTSATRRTRVRSSVCSCLPVRRPRRTTQRGRVTITSPKIAPFI